MTKYEYNADNKTSFCCKRKLCVCHLRLFFDATELKKMKYANIYAAHFDHCKDTAP